MILVVFQVAVLRRGIPNLAQIASGAVMVLLGLALFLIGLERALFPIGETMAEQLTEQAGSLAGAVRWENYWLVYLFGAAIGFATTVAEPSLIAVALKAEEVSGRRGAIQGSAHRRGGRGGRRRLAGLPADRDRHPRCRGTSWRPT